MTGHPRSPAGAAAFKNDTDGPLYHVVRTRWYGEGKVVDTRSHDWRSSLGLHGDRLAACEMVAALYRDSGDTLSAIVTLGWHAFTAHDTIERAHREYVNVGGRGLGVRDVERFVTSIGRYNPTFRNGMDGLRIRETIFEVIRASFHPGSPSRLDSMFGSTNLTFAERYLATCMDEGDQERACSLICTVEPEGPVVRVEVDGKWIDDVEEDFTYAQTEIALKEYWAGRMQYKGRPELLLQGRFQYGRKIASSGNRRPIR